MKVGGPKLNSDAKWKFISRWPQKWITFGGPFFVTLNDLHLKMILIKRKLSISVHRLLYLTSSNSSISSFELNNFFLISWTVFFGWNLNSVWLIHFEVRLSLKITTIKLFFVSCSVIWIICLIWASWILQMFFASSIKVFRILFFTFRDSKWAVMDEIRRSVGQTGSSK